MGVENAPDSTVHDLVFAIAHEIGNHLGAIRIQAHLLDEELDPRSLAQASVEIDGLAGHAGPMLALLRPLLSSQIPVTNAASWSGLLTAIRQRLEDEGARGVSVAIEEPSNSAPLAPGVDWLHSLLSVLLDATLAITPHGGTIRLGLDSQDGESVFFMEDDGAEEDLSPGASLRGRPLSVALARHLIPQLGGRVEIRRTGATTRVDLVFPTGH